MLYFITFHFFLKVVDMMIKLRNSAHFEWTRSLRRRVLETNAIFTDLFWLFFCFSFFITNLDRFSLPPFAFATALELIPCSNVILFRNYRSALEPSMLAPSTCNRLHISSIMVSSCPSLPLFCIHSCLWQRWKELPSYEFVYATDSKYDYFIGFILYSEPSIYSLSRLATLR